MPIKDNIKARKAAQELMDMGITLAKENDLPPEHVRIYWQHIVDSSLKLIGEKQKPPNENSKKPNRVKSSKRLQDDDLMFFGKHKGEKLIDVPEDYLKWLANQDWIDQYPDLVEYLNVM
jgi:hypothetical protein